MATKVEVAFDLNSGNDPYFTLDNATRGVLDNTTYKLGGIQFIDISSYVTSINIRRGKNRQLDRFNAGSASIRLNNETRAFDPTYVSSPFYGNIIPRREVRISTDDNFIFTGVIDDWNLDYSVTGKSNAEAVASDGFTVLAQQTLTAGTATAQYSGARINAVLNDPKVQWPIERRDIDTGISYLGADVIAADTNALQYLQLVETSEQGAFFISKTGYVTFLDRTVVPTTSTLTTLADNGTGIPFTASGVQYGTELLYNEIKLTSAITGATAIASDLPSQNLYGISNYTIDGLLLNSNTELGNTAVFLAQKYSEPEFRFETIEVQLDGLNVSQKSQILALELGSVCKIVFTPNNIAPAITKYAEVISIGHKVGIDRHSVSLGFSTLDFSYLVLNDAEFGKLDTGNALSY